MNLRTRLTRLEQRALCSVPSAVGVVVDVDLEAWEQAEQTRRHYVNDEPCDLSTEDQYWALAEISVPWDALTEDNKRRHRTAVKEAGLDIDCDAVWHLGDEIRQLVRSQNYLHAGWLIEQGQPLPDDIREEAERDLKRMHGYRTIEERVGSMAQQAQLHLETNIQAYNRFAQHGPRRGCPPERDVAILFIVAHGRMLGIHPEEDDDDEPESTVGPGTTSTSGASRR